MFNNLPDDIIKYIMDIKTEEEQKDNKKKMLIELNDVISYAKYDFYEDCQVYNYDYHTWTDYVNNFKGNVILSVYEQYKNIY